MPVSGARRSRIQYTIIPHSHCWEQPVLNLLRSTELARTCIPALSFLSPGCPDTRPRCVFWRGSLDTSRSSSQTAPICRLPRTITQPLAPSALPGNGHSASKPSQAFRDFQAHSSQTRFTRWQCKSPPPSSLLNSTESMISTEPTAPTQHNPTRPQSIQITPHHVKEQQARPWTALCKPPGISAKPNYLVPSFPIRCISVSSMFALLAAPY